MKPKVSIEENNKVGGMAFYSSQPENLEVESKHIFKFKVKCHQIFLRLDFFTLLASVT